MTYFSKMSNKFPNHNNIQSEFTQKSEIKKNIKSLQYLNVHKISKVGHSDLSCTNLIEVPQMNLHTKCEQNLYNTFREEVDNVFLTLVTLFP